MVRSGRIVGDVGNNFEIRDGEVGGPGKIIFVCCCENEGDGELMPAFVHELCETVDDA